MNDTEKQTNEWSKREVGALWLKQGSNQKYFSGHVKMTDDYGAETTQRVVVFSNKKKTKSNQPDFRIYLSKDRENQSEQSEQQESQSQDSQPQQVEAQQSSEATVSVEDTL